MKSFWKKWISASRRGRRDVPVRRIAAVAVSLSLLMAGCEPSSKGPPIRPLVKGSQPVNEVELKATPPDSDPVLGAGDEIEISVYRNPELTRQIVIPPSQTIDMPLIGEVEVRGASAAELRRTLTEKLAKYIKDPQVSVRTTAVRSQNFLVLGEVAQPGEYSSATLTSALQAVARAGGFTEDARRQVVLIRPSGEKADAYVLDLGRAFKSADLRANVSMASGDILYVPPNVGAQIDRFARHFRLWLEPVIGVESAVILGDEIGERFENSGESNIVIGP